MAAPNADNGIRLYQNDGTTLVAVLENAWGAIAPEQLLDDVGGEATVTFNMPLSDPKNVLIREEMCLRITTAVHDPTVALVNALDEIYTIRSTTDGYQDDGSKVFTVYAEARWYDLDTLDVITIDPAVTTIADALDVICAGTGWTRGVITQGQPAGAVAFASTDLITPLAALRALPAIFGGELFFDTVNKQVSLLNRRGNQVPVFQYVRSGNIASDVRTISTSGLTTRVHPIGANGLDISTVNGNVPYIEDYSYFDSRGMARQVRAQKIENANINDPVALLQWAQNQLTTMAQPQRTYALKVSLLAGDGFPHLGDLVRVVDGTLALDTYARVSRREIDVIQPWNSVLTIDTAAYTLATPGTGGNGLPSGSTGADTTVPDPPTNLRLVFGSGLDPNGNWNTYGIVIFDAPTANSDGTPITDLDHYDVEILPAGAPEWQPMGASSDTAIGIGYVPSNETLQVRVRAVDHSYNRSAWVLVSALVPLPTPFYLPPTQPVLDSDTFPLCVRVIWDGLDNNNVRYPPDVDKIEIHMVVGVVSSFVPDLSTLQAVIPAGEGGFTYPVTGLVAGTSYTFELVAVGRLDTKSKPSLATAATVLPVGPTHLVYNGDQDNIVPDGSFETAGGQARLMADPSWKSSWSFVTAATAPGARGASAVAHGTFALMGTGGTLTGQDRAVVFISTATTSNEKLWAKIRYWNATTGGNCILGIAAYDSAGVLIETSGLTLPPNGGYSLQAFNYTLPINCATYAFYVEMDPNISAGYLFVDAVELRTITQTAIIDQLAVTDAQIASASISKLTAGFLTADMLLSARIATGNGVPRLDMNSLGLFAYNGSGINTVKIGSDGSATFTGTITGSTIVGGTIETALSGRRVVLDSSTNGLIQFYSGHANESIPSYMFGNIDGATSLPMLNLVSPTLVGFSDVSAIELFPGQGGGGHMLLYGPGGIVMQAGSRTVFANIDLNGDVVLEAGTGYYYYGGSPMTRSQDATASNMVAGAYVAGTDSNGYLNGVPHGLTVTPRAVVVTPSSPIGGVTHLPFQVMTDSFNPSNFRARFFDTGGAVFNSQNVLITFIAVV